MTVYDMLSKMPSYEITYWQAYFQIEMKDKKSKRSKKEMLENLKGRHGRRLIR